ncbi:hypothetical protein [Amycolatopsis sulphurea]|uniref:hypothetical protein n=1 Tax=Amycolatopsis sulphurea TaxID=76022 RepID=UPI0014763F4A|nr:hypothetical protein [Amycolatopsis sulphurea]
MSLDVAVGDFFESLSACMTRGRLDAADRDDIALARTSALPGSGAANTRSATNLLVVA